ncbi:hypothetical protein BDW59DRAFT_180669 [Aspergillus cavernicola]|uniref:Zn(2)-C6 fungal-type domain-containing protein n=1 Tax=Aspergillus cavernicola TaxID=176166 RepID=A0ABR4I908_9EURO
MSSRRRNGQPASCEPCRKDKVRCDHQAPVCGLCQQRNTASRCFYHPAPLTQNTKSPISRIRAPRNVPATREAGRREMQRLASPTPSSVEITIRSLRTDHSLPSGYFGPTSFVSAFDGSPASTSTPSNDIPQRRTKVLSSLTEYPTVECLVDEFYRTSQAVIVPTPFILNCMSGMRGIIEEGETPQGLHKKTTRILENTAQRLQIPSDVRGADFFKLFTGNRLRLEVIGTVYAIAGRASLFGFAHGRFLGSAGSPSAARIKFAQKMLTASDTALQVCRILTPVNDLTTWLLYENFLLSCMVIGDSSSHRDCPAADIPIFLRETRRRLFAGLYQLDKNFATFLGRPLRISWRYCDGKLPLDISEDALVADEQGLERAVGELDSEGWNTRGVFQRSSWCRLRYLISRFREEVLELSLRPLGPETIEKLRDISFRCTQTWNSIPAHLRYASNQWDHNLPVGVRVMLLAAYNLYLYNIFLILSTVLMLGRQQEPIVDIQRDYITTIAIYGFSSASILIKALQTQARTGKPMPYTGSRAELIRNLSVFVSHIESMARPPTANVNHALFDRASKMFSNILDEALDPRLLVSSSSSSSFAGGSGGGTGAEAEVEMGMGIPDGGGWDDSWAAVGMEFLDTLDFGVVFDQWVF